MPRTKLQQQWNHRNHAILEQATAKNKGGKELPHLSYVKKTEQTELVQYIAAHPEIPEEMEIIRQEAAGRTHARISTRKSSHGLTQQEGTLPGQKWKFTRLNCRRPFCAPIGKTNNIKQKPECQNVSRRETFENKCQDCGRTFNEPVNLGERQKFVCSDLRRTMQTQKKPKKEKMMKKRRRDRRTNIRARKSELCMRQTTTTQGIGRKR